MTPTDLSGCYAKLVRARQHIEALRSAFQGGIAVQMQPRQNLFGDVEFVVSEVEQPPMAWGTIVGDAVHNLRSALDHLVCALARAEGFDCEHPRTSFPIVWQAHDLSWWHDVDHWNKRWRERANNELQPLRPEDREFFRLVQPYHAYWPSENIGSVYQHPLAMLERLWLTDKHRLLATALYALEGFNQSDVEVEDAIMGPRSWARRPLRVGVVAFTFHWTITGPSPSFHWSGAVRSRLAFEDGIDVLETLDAGHAAVAEILVRIEHSRPTDA